MIEKLEAPSTEEACLSGAVSSRLYWCGATETSSAKGQGLQAAQEIGITEEGGRKHDPIGNEGSEGAEMIREKETAEKHVLVVDDEPGLLEVMSMCLEEEGFQVQTAADGQQALECLKGNQYDAIVSDIQMPVMCGKQLYQRMASDPVLRKSLDRMIFVSGDAFSENTQRFIQDNALAWLSKPFLLGELQEKVRRVIGCFESPGAQNDARLLPIGNPA